MITGSSMGVQRELYIVTLLELTVINKTTIAVRTIVLNKLVDDLLD
jgi:hypothetical protein